MRLNINDDATNWELIRQAGALAQAIRGKHGQAFLRELLAALEALPVKELIDAQLYDAAGNVCALGAVVKSRGLDLPADEFPEQTADALNITNTLAKEIVYQNDEVAFWRDDTPSQRYNRVLHWVRENIKEK